MPSWQQMPCEEFDKRDGQGYGYTYIRTGFPPETKRVGMHVVTYEECFGPVPDGLKVLHHCDNPPCRQPLHLFVGTQADNMRDMREKGRNVIRGQAKMLNTSCRAGHPYDDGTYRLDRDGFRTCLICEKARR